MNWKTLTFTLAAFGFMRLLLCAEAESRSPLGLCLHAIAQVESGDNPSKIGRHGERTRWQIRPTEWEERSEQDFKAADDAEGRRVAETILSSRIQAFELNHLRSPTLPEVYLLWHRPARVLTPSSAEKERADRFANLFELAKRRAAGESVARAP